MIAVDGVEELGLSVEEVPVESTGREIAIGVGGIVLVIAAAIPVVWAVLTGVIFIVPIVSGLFGGGVQPAE